MRERQAKQRSLAQAQLDRLKAREIEKRDGIAFQRMGASLWCQEQALKREKRVTAFYGIPSSWRKVEEYGKYYYSYSRKTVNPKKGIHAHRAKPETTVSYHRVL